MENGKLSKGTLINGKYRILELKANTCFGPIYKAINTCEKGSYVELYQLKDEVIDVGKHGVSAEKLKQFEFENVTYIAVPSEDDACEQQESFLLELKEIDELYSKGVSKKKYKYRMEANSRYEKLRKNHNELFLKHLSSVNNLADDYLYYYGEDYTRQGTGSYNENILNKKAFMLYTESACRNSPYGQYQLAYCYENGYGCECNYSLAAEWYEEAFKNGYSVAAKKLGDFYFKVFGVKQNYSTAVNYYSNVQEINADACIALADCYYKGLGVESNTEKAFEYLHKSYDLGSNKTILRLAECYLTGNGVEKNFAKARVLLKKAALKGKNVAELICDYYLGEKIGFLNNAKGVGYMALSNWTSIVAVFAFIAVIVGFIFTICMFK